MDAAGLDTIAAIASAPGGAARAIVRISGPDTVSVIQALCGGQLVAVKRPATTRLTLRLKSASEAALFLPCQVLLWPGRRSYTRQPLAEIHLAGSPALVERVLSETVRCGARLARPGEYTLRAFLAGRVDLFQAEAVLGVIDAQEERAFKTALAQLAGGLSRPLCELRGMLLDLLADLEAGLDFADEDIEFVTPEQLLARLQAAEEQLQALAARLTSRAARDEPPRVVLAGLPNSGKSRLFNALSQSSTALVSATAGTTRDFLSVTVDFSDVTAQLIDTAGIEAAAPRSFAAAAQNFTSAQIERAELRLLCLDASRPEEPWETAQLARFRATEATQDNLSSLPTILIATKSDLPSARQFSSETILTSAATGAGLAELQAAITARLRQQPGEAVAGTATRCRAGIESASAALRRGGELAARRGGDELVAAEIRVALAEIGQLSGAVYTEDLLDRIFSRFCLGK